MIGKWKAIWGLGPVLDKWNSCAGFGDKEPNHLVFGNVMIWLNVYVQSECSCKTTLYLYVRNSSWASGISVLRIELKLEISMFLTRPNTLVLNFSRWVSLFRHYMLGQISIILLKSFPVPTSITKWNTKLPLEHWVQTINFGSMVRAEKLFGLKIWL